MLQKLSGPLVGGGFLEATVRPNMLNMPKSASAAIYTKNIKRRKIKKKKGIILPACITTFTRFQLIYA